MLLSIVRPSPFGISASLCRSFLSRSTTTTTAIPARISQIIASSSFSHATILCRKRTNEPRSHSTSIPSYPSSAQPLTKTTPPAFKLHLATKKCLFSTTSAAMIGEGRMFPPDRRWTTPRASNRRPMKDNKVVVADETKGPDHRVMPWEKRDEPEWVTKYRQAAQLSNDKKPKEMTMASRLLPSLIFTLLVIIGSSTYAYFYTPPLQKDRLFPEVPQALSTVCAIIAINALVWFAWKIPPAWRTLNRLFIVVPATPNPLSMVGAAFSHQGITHLAMNMVVLFLWGPTLCDQVGRANFIAMYLTAGAVGCFGSLSFYVLTKNLFTSALGASGAVFGIMGAFAFLNPDHPLQFIFFPFVDFTALSLVTAVATIEVISAATNFMPHIDRIAHLSGLGAGVLFMWILYERSKRKREQMREELTKKYGR